MDKVDESKNPREVVPIYIRDFLGDFTYVSSETMTDLYNNFDASYRSSAHPPEPNGPNRKALFDSIEITLLVEDADFLKSTDELLVDLKFESAMKRLPTNRILKIAFTFLDESTQVVYRTNGIRIKVEADTNFTEMIQYYAKEVNPVNKLRLMGMHICGGIRALACEDNCPDWYLSIDDSEDSI
jgi:hypothetical protein